MKERTSKQLLIVLAVMISLVMIVIGGKAYMDKREERKAQELLAVEKQSVQALKNTFADIAEVKIEQFDKNEMTGFYRAMVTMTNTKGESVYFDYGFIAQTNELGAYGIEDIDIQKEGITTRKIKAIYSNGQEEDV
ncbi:MULTISPECIES: hypothetical protein [Enterococcus]|uniref:DUF1310 family protein n=1 Tax=Candidatus Enterococcus mangumiae TaxID=2230878 RepID=A0ABZ2SY72_9ENTE|nr:MULTISPECIES: hypothetical protein [unclassified Enterococcus]MBO0461626.1 hypothetical protein [Enterococcus sp. DIV1298c]MBO0490063.1 hypothetical protein [Enterococcus sp. DIV1094]MBO1300937.1 hypothetical protein [Enterococcus sp. DIV1271a]